MTIKLEGLDFFAYHGVSDEEQKIGNKYTVDIELELSDETIDFASDDISITVNYAEVYEEVKTIMSVSTRLLETIANKINIALIRRFHKILTTSTTVSKHNPPINGICNKASVKISQKR